MTDFSCNIRASANSSFELKIDTKPRSSVFCSRDDKIEIRSTFTAALNWKPMRIQIKNHILLDPHLIYRSNGVWRIRQFQLSYISKPAYKSKNNLLNTSSSVLLSSHVPLERRPADGNFAITDGTCPQIPVTTT